MNRTELVDINDVTVSDKIPKKERIREYIRQIKNPYLFKCGDIAVTVSFANQGKALEESLIALLS